jgi:hypothetical protein
MDWKRVAQLLNTPVDRLRARFSSDPQERQLAAWEARMRAQTKELARLAELLREALGRSRATSAEVQAFDERAEQAIREGDDASARAILLEKQDAVKRHALARDESQALATAARRARERLAATRAEANALLRQAGLPPLEATEGAPFATQNARSQPAEAHVEPAPAHEAPRVRIKL